MPFIVELKGAKCENPASLVEVEILPYEGGWIYGDEKAPDLKEFKFWLSRKGFKREFIERENGSVDILIYANMRSRRPKKAFRIKPNEEAQDD